MGYIHGGRGYADDGGILSRAVFTIFLIFPSGFSLAGTKRN